MSKSIFPEEEQADVQSLPNWVKKLLVRPDVVGVRKSKIGKATVFCVAINKKSRSQGTSLFREEDCEQEEI